jgi:hypothetical protein
VSTEGRATAENQASTERRTTAKGRMTAEGRTTAELAERIAGAVLAHPAVARLHAGPFGAIASYLPGRRVDGVKIAHDGSAIDVAVVVDLAALEHYRPIPLVAQQLRTAVRELVGDARVDVLIVDLVQAKQNEEDLR